MLPCLPACMFSLIDWLFFELEIAENRAIDWRTSSRMFTLSLPLHLLGNYRAGEFLQEHSCALDPISSSIFWQWLALLDKCAPCTLWKSQTLYKSAFLDGRQKCGVGIYYIRDFSRYFPVTTHPILLPLATIKTQIQCFYWSLGGRESGVLTVTGSNISTT